ALGCFQLADQERMFVRRPQLRGCPTIQIDQWVVPECFEKDRRARGSEGSSDFRKSGREGEMMEDRDPADQGERWRLEFQLCGVHAPKVDRLQIICARAIARLTDRDL